jgi:hypothetical protein
MEEKKIRDANQIAAMIMLQWVELIFEEFNLLFIHLVYYFFHERSCIEKPIFDNCIFCQDKSEETSTFG